MKLAEEYTFDFMQKLEKGDEFTLNEKKYSVKSVGNWKSSYLSLPLRTVTVVSEKGQVKLYYLAGGYHGNPRSMSKASHIKQHQILRDAEGLVIVDLLNANNKFHEPSDIYKISIR